MWRDGVASTWQPLLDGVQRVEALSVVESIASDLISCTRLLLRDGGSTHFAVSPMLAGGAPGIALFLAFRERIVGLSERALAVELLERAAVELTQGATHFGLYGGLAGLSWTLRTIERLAAWATIPQVDISEMLDDLLSRTDWKYYYDLTDGLLGVGVCVLNDSSSVARDRRISSILGHLDNSAEYDPYGAYWSVRPDFIQSPADLTTTTPYVNMGMAHGVPSIVAWLATALESGYRDEPLTHLLPDATNWLIRHTDVADSSEPRLNLLGWCYGDLGIASAVALAGYASKNVDWLDAARRLAVATTLGQVGRTAVSVAGLCHGASGLGHLYHRLYHRLGDDVLREAALRWYAIALSMHQPGFGFGGYRDLVAKGTRDDPGFLRGAAGIGLALMAAVSDVEPTWDQALLLSSANQSPVRSSHTSTLHDA